MYGFRRFEYWRELLLVLLMLTVLMLDLALFDDSLRPFGEDGGATSAVRTVEQGE